MPPDIDLNPVDLARYARQLDMPGFTRADQIRMKGKFVVILGLGGTGGPAALYLAAAGIGKIRLVDRDRVELSNLNRQILYAEDHLGQKKARRAAEALRAFNSSIDLEAFDREVRETNLEELVGQADCVVCALDESADRLLVNHHCFRKGIPANYAFVHGFRAEVISVLPKRRPCLACLIDEKAVCTLTGTGAVLGVTAGLAGLIQAGETLKTLIRPEWVRTGRRLFLDLTDMTMTPLECGVNPDCPCCSGNREYEI